MIAELFTDGRALFDLSQLLEYCSEDVSSDKTDNTLKTDIRISDKYVRVSNYSELFRLGVK